MTRKIFLYSDGGAKGNPGPAGIGFIILDERGFKVTQQGKFIGEATNNQAEYQAVIEGLSTIGQILKNKGDLEVHCLLDSQLVVEQLNQRYKIKDENLKQLFWQIRDLILSLGGRVIFEHISREQNKQADKLVNLAVQERDDV